MRRVSPPLIAPAVILVMVCLCQSTGAQDEDRELYGANRTADPYAEVPPAQDESQDGGSNPMPSPQHRAPMQNGPISGTTPMVTASPETPLSLAQSSWTYTPPPPIRKIQVNDIVTIRVDELAQVRAEGTSDSRKNTLFDAILKDWISLNDGDLVPDPQSNGDPRVGGTVRQQNRADASLETRESLTLNVAARVVEIMPNGHLVLEAHKTIWVNDNAWETSLSGICRPQDVAPDNVILSRDIIDLQVRKQERGHVRDGYRRGWFQRWFEVLQPF